MHSRLAPEHSTAALGWRAAPDGLPWPAVVDDDAETIDLEARKERLPTHQIIAG
jgi:hypothetical protein